MIRPIASFGEISDVIDLMEGAFMRSRWGLTPGAKVDRKQASKILTNTSQRQGLMAAGGTFFHVAETDGQLTGFMIGEIDRIYGVGNLLCAQDIYLYSRGEGADPIDWIRLVRAYIDWAKKVKGLVQILLQETDFAGAEIPEEVRRAYQHFGFKQTGTIHEWRPA